MPRARPISSSAARFRKLADPDAKRQEIIENYRKELYNPYVAACRGYIDAVIPPSETRMRLIEILETLCNKRERGRIGSTETFRCELKRRNGKRPSAVQFLQKLGGGS